jgi:hypothetical protein
MVAGAVFDNKRSAPIDDIKIAFIDTGLDSSGSKMKSDKEDGESRRI